MADSINLNFNHKNELRFRCVTDSDLEELSLLGKQTFTETFGHMYSAKELDDHLVNNYSVSIFKKFIDAPGCAIKIAEILLNSDSYRMIGFCKIGPMKMPLENLQEGSNEIWQLYVLREFHGKGVAYPLMDWALMELTADKGKDSIIYLGVWCENIRAQKFYHKYGFVVHSEYKFYVGNDGHYDVDYIMKWDPAAACLGPFSGSNVPNVSLNTSRLNVPLTLQAV